MPVIRHCPQCQRPLASDAPDDLCPACLLQVGLGSVPEPAGTIHIGEEAVRVRELPKPGTQFGGYQVVRELGRGGMGAVYEAEQLESGRRIALKVLSHQLDSMADRARFLREGRLAGSINHPNSVYVFGTEEIEDTPAIAMELIAGGTLQERVQRNGPLPIGEAVDAILQVIAGLEAAQKIGILHRDIKPANCFQDVDGTVKVGDFGLSISTAARGDTNITMQGQFLGTPAFCSPEQLRGEELNLRSDMYSVGVTLFYLLTGRTPFEGKNMVQLLANVIEKPAPSPKTLRPVVPAQLAAVVLRCLNKQPGERYKSYDELRQALAPFGLDAPVPAPIPLRFVAGAIDTFVLTMTGILVSYALTGFEGLASFMNPALFESSKYRALMALSFGLSVFYYTLLEGWRGGALGKMICGLRVVGPDRNPPGIWRALPRTLMFLTIPALPMWIVFSLGKVSLAGSGMWVLQIVGISSHVLLALMFSTVRRRNGLATVYDLLTKTRVIRKPAHEARPVLATSEIETPATENRPKIGPFHVIASLQGDGVNEWLLGYDTRLLRKVWIHVVPAGTPPVAPALRNLGRVGRLRWISGRRTPEENWDVFEGVSGVPLVTLLAQPWTRVRYWLFDLATEISAAEKEGTIPAVLAMDRVWITNEGRAKLLDFPAPGLAGDAPANSSEPPVAFTDVRLFLGAIAELALRGSERKTPPVPPLPLHARTFLHQLPSMPGASDIVAALKLLLNRVASISRLRRAGVLFGCAVFPVIIASMIFFGMKSLTRWQTAEPKIAELGALLNFRATIKLPWVRNNPHPDDRTIGLYIASHYRETITNPAQWKTVYALSTINGENRTFAEQSVANNPQPSPPEISKADQALAGVMKEMPGKNVAPLFAKPWFAVAMFGVVLIIYVALPALLAALCFRGGLVLRICGLTVAKSDGTPASRGRMLWRACLAWSPVLFAAFLAGLLQPLKEQPWLAVTLPLLLVVCPSVISLCIPERSVQDRLAGTWLVPK